VQGLDWPNTPPKSEPYTAKKFGFSGFGFNIQTFLLQNHSRVTLKFVQENCIWKKSLQSCCTLFWKSIVLKQLSGGVYTPNYLSIEKYENKDFLVMELLGDDMSSSSNL
jgi:hypothetical protein